MRVGRKTIWAGSPRKACGPKSAIESTAASSAPPVIAGATSGRVILRVTVQRPAPSICAELLEGRVDGAERAMREEVAERKGMEADDEDDAAHGEDVEGTSRQCRSG